MACAPLASSPVGHDWLTATILQMPWRSVVHFTLHLLSPRKCIVFVTIDSLIHYLKNSRLPPSSSFQYLSWKLLVLLISFLFLFLSFNSWHLFLLFCSSYCFAKCESDHKYMRSKSPRWFSFLESAYSTCLLLLCASLFCSRCTKAPFWYPLSNRWYEIQSWQPSSSKLSSASRTLSET